MRYFRGSLLVGLCLVCVAPATSVAAETKVEADARAALASGNLAQAGDLYLEAFRRTANPAHARQAGLIYVRLGVDRSADARYALTLYMRAAKTPAELQDAKDLLLIAGGDPNEGGAPNPPPAASPPPAPSRQPGTKVTTETQIDTRAGTMRQTESTAAGTTSTAVDAKNQTVTHSETDATGTRSTHIDAQNREVGYSSESADGKQTMNASANSEGAAYEQNVDCSANPGLDVCQEQTKAGLSGGGLTASYKKTEITKVTSLQKNPSEVRLGASYASASSDGGVSTSMFGVSGTGQWSFGQLPTAGGGKFFGPSLGASMSLSYGSLGGGIDGSMSQFVVNAPLGFQFYSFGEQNPETLEQSGFGIFAGYTLGASSTTTSIDIDGETNETKDGSFAHGPRVNVTFPTMNWGTSKMSGFGISGMLLPLEAATVFFLSAEWVMGSASPVQPAPPPAQPAPTASVAGL